MAPAQHGRCGAAQAQLCVRWRWLGARRQCTRPLAVVLCLNFAVRRARSCLVPGFALCQPTPLPFPLHFHLFLDHSGNWVCSSPRRVPHHVPSSSPPVNTDRTVPRVVYRARIVLCFAPYFYFGYPTIYEAKRLLSGPPILMI